MNKPLLALLAATASITAGAAIADEIIPDAAAVGGEFAIKQIANSAFYEHELTGGDWGQTLSRTILNLRQGGENVTVSDTTVTWMSGEECVTADLPQPETPVVITIC